MSNEFLKEMDLIYFNNSGIGTSSEPRLPQVLEKRPFLATAMRHNGGRPATPREISEAILPSDIRNAQCIACGKNNMPDCLKCVYPDIIPNDIDGSKE